MNIVDECFDELLLNLIMTYPRINSNWVSWALDVPLGRANRHLKQWLDAGVIRSYRAGAYTNYERVYYFAESMPEFFQEPKTQAGNS
jgi:hypothetical protein